ncbi:hypothetical protein, unknown function [Leishmania tarentolae]|uniref:Uncharacterized protein n=1 Tax=Leishmania tarentolae TaxID=5689 RepID=A0A640KSP5_LEITA|nr:hypothetical protein, unknown function [Leishmania tarentolae]
MSVTTDMMAISASPSDTESLERATATMASDSCPSPAVTATAITTTASFAPTHTPKSVQPPTTSRCLVRPLSLPRRHSKFNGPQHHQQQSSCAPNPATATLCESEPAGAGGVEILLAKQHQPMHTVVSSRNLDTAAGQQERQQGQEGGAETAIDGDAAAKKLATENEGADHSSATTTAGGTAMGIRCIAIQPLSDQHTAAVFNGATCDQEDKRQATACTTPANSAHPCGQALAVPPPAAYPSSLSTNTAYNSSASSSFYGASASTSRTAGAGRGHATTPSLFSSALPHGTQACNGNGSRSGTNTEAKVVPLLLRTWLTTHTTGEELGSPAATLRPAPRNLVSRQSLAVPQAPIGALPPSGATSMGSVTPVSSNRSSDHPSFTRPPSVTLTSGEQGSIKVPGGLRSISGSGGGNDKGSPTAGIVRAINGRVLCFPHGARRPDIGARRTTFQRSNSNLSGTETSLSRGALPPSDSCEDSSGVAVAKGIALPPPPPPPPSIPKEMQSFILSQYRTLQRDVISLPVAPQSVDDDVTTADFQHIKKTTCSKHSKAAKKALKAQEEVRLRALQQQHHDMEVIRNGGREQVGQNMKSSVLLAGSLSKLRARTRSSLGRGTATGLGASPATSFIGSPEECSADALYPGNSPCPAALERNDAAELQAPERAPEAWHTSKAFMAWDGPTGVQRHGLPSRSLSKCRMKGEGIVMEMVLDSEDEEDADSNASSYVETRRQSHVGQCHRSAHVGSAGMDELSSNTATKRAGERLASQPQRRRGAAASLKCSEGDSHSSSSSNEECCFSFNQQRSSRMRSTSPVSPTQPLEFLSPPVTSGSEPRASLSTHAHGRSHYPFNAMTPFLAHNYSECDGYDDVEDECCHCCPCKRPKNFFALCRTNSHSAASLLWRGDKQNLSAKDVQEEKQSSMDISFTNPDCNQFVVEDLEDSDEDEPMLSMQSFRRANVRRIR